MDIEKRKLSDIKPNQKNVRKHTDSQIEEFKKSILKFDVIRPIVIDEDGIILAGHGLYEALRQLGYEEADVMIKRGLSERDKKKLLLADNKIYSLGFDDYSAIESILKELGSDSDFEVPGYDSEILENLYGIKSVESEVQTAKPMEDLGVTQEGVQTPTEAHQDANPYVEPEPSKHVTEARAEAQNRKFIICPNCGEKIEV